MKKLLLLFAIIASIVVPARAARIKDGKAALKKVLIQIAICDLIYLILVTQVWFRLYP